MKRFLSTIGILALIALGFGAGVLYTLELPPSLHQVGADAYVSEEANAAAQSAYVDEAGGYIDVRPAGEVRTLFIFYPGGLVAPQAYEWLGVALAPSGVRTVIVNMPLNLAVLAPGRASKVLDSLGTTPEHVVIGGHSLGGAMAVRYACNHTQTLDGLVLMAAYPAENNDLSQTSLNTLVLAAARDGLISSQELKERMTLLPEETRLESLPGAVHSFFGRYGPQRGDGVPTTTRAAAEVHIVRVLQSFLSNVTQESAALR